MHNSEHDPYHYCNSAAALLHMDNDDPKTLMLRQVKSSDKRRSLKAVVPGAY